MAESLPDVPDEQVLSELSERALALYDQKLKAALEPRYHGQIVAIHPDSGDYEVAPHSSRARFALRARHPEGLIITLDIGPVDADDPLTLRMLGTQLLAGQPRK